MKEVIVILIILAIILVAYFVFWLIDFMKARESKKILKNNTAQLNRLVEQVRQEQEKEKQKQKALKAKAFKAIWLCSSARFLN